MVKHIRRFGTQFFLDSSPYGHFNVNIEQAYLRTQLERQSEIMESVDVMEKNTCICFSTKGRRTIASRDGVM